MFRELNGTDGNPARLSRVPRYLVPTWYLVPQANTYICRYLVTYLGRSWPCFQTAVTTVRTVSKEIKPVRILLLL